MLFNSIHFLFFLPLVVLFFYIIPSKYRKYLLLIASYYFYIQWNAPYIFLIILSTVIDFILGIELTKERFNKKILLTISFISNLGLLVTFKYFDFFIEQINTVFGGNIHYLDLVLPIGISFYTFQTMSYTIDVYNKKLKPETDFIVFAVYVSFFPQLVAGPIERAAHLLKELKRKIKFSYSNLSHGIKLIIWGFFKKVVIADNVSVHVDKVFDNYQGHDEASIVLAVIFFSIQIYCDFSGYTDIAIGSAKLFGIKLNKNFNFPYFSRSISEFWRRWHISLSTWFRDYLYIPLGGNRVSFSKIIMNILIVFIVSGFWHGANWTYIVWGTIHGVFVILEMVLGKLNLNNIKSLMPVLLLVCFKRFYTVSIVLIAWVFFRANNVGEAFGILNKITDDIGFTSIPQLYELIFSNEVLLVNTSLIIILLAIEGGMLFKKLHIKINTSHMLYRHASYGLLISLILLFGAFDRSEFIYFQF